MQDTAKNLTTLMEVCGWADLIQDITHTSMNSNQCIQAIKEGGEDALVGLLLYFVPNIRAICFNDLTKYPGCILNLLEGMASERLSSLLSKLRKFNISISGVVLENNLEVPLDIVQLPSLTTIYASRIEGFTREVAFGNIRIQGPPGKGYHGRSGVTELKLMGCNMRTSRLCSLIRMCKSLESFSYEPCNLPSDKDDNDDYSDFYPWDIAQDLRSMRNDTLKHFTLQAGSREPTWMGSLNNWKVLQTLQTDWRLLLGRKPTQKEVFAMLLPPSIENLHLKVDSTFDVKAGYEKIAHVNDLKKAKLPLLKDLQLLDLDIEDARYLMQGSVVKYARNTGLIISCHTKNQPGIVERDILADL